MLMLQALLPGYKAAMNNYTNAVRDLADRLLPLIAMALKLPSNFFDQYFHKPIGTLRPLHYNAQMSLPDEVNASNA
jgi:isopenicillin N synthase-like dioxygenase